MFIYRERRSNRSSRAKRFEQSAEVQRLERFELNSLLLYVSTFHYSTVLVLSFRHKNFLNPLVFRETPRHTSSLNLMEVEKEDDFRFDGYDCSKHRLTWRA